MAGKTNTHADAVLNILRNTAASAIASPYIGLFSTMPADDGATGTELTAGGYARQAVTFGAPSAGSGTSRQIANTGALTFGPASGSDWPSAVGFGVYDGASGGLKYFNTFSTPKTVAVGDSGVYAVGACVVTED